MDELLNPSLNDTLEASGVSPYGPDAADFPTGIGLGAVSDEELDRWRAEGERVLRVIERELVTWRSVKRVCPDFG